MSEKDFILTHVSAVFAAVRVQSGGPIWEKTARVKDNIMRDAVREAREIYKLLPENLKP